MAQAKHMYAGVPLQQHVARILGRRGAEVLAAVDRMATSELIESLAHEVLAALTAEFVDPDGAYHAFDPEPFPSIARVTEAIRAYADTLTARGVDAEAARSDLERERA